MQGMGEESENRVYRPSPFSLNPAAVGLGSPAFGAARISEYFLVWQRCPIKGNIVTSCCVVQCFIALFIGASLLIPSRSLQCSSLRALYNLLLGYTAHWSYCLLLAAPTELLLAAPTELLRAYYLHFISGSHNPAPRKSILKLQT